MESVRPQTIQIFLPDGNPRSVKIAEITSRTIQIVMFPRSKLDLVSSREELKNVAIYFLVGSEDELSNPFLYIGEAEDCLYRTKEHNKSKEFWNIGLAAISKTQYFTKSHVKYLEWLCFISAKKAERYTLDNSTIPTKPYISESMEADLLDNFETIKILVSTLGFPLFDDIKGAKRVESIFLKGKDAYAEGAYNEDGVVVFMSSPQKAVQLLS